MTNSRNITRLYFIAFFHNLIPAYVIERLFWQERGMTVFMVVLCEIIYAVTIVLCEIPTGILADKFGRKALLVIGAVLSMLEFIILLFAFNFWTFAFVVFLAGIAGACTSGASNALLYDSLMVLKKEHSFEKIVGILNSFDFIGSLLAALSGSVLAKTFGLEFNYMLSAASMFIALAFTVFLAEPPRKPHQMEDQGLEKSFAVYFISSVKFFKTNPKLVVIITNSMAIGACVSYLDEFWQLYLDDIGFSILFFGVFSAAISLVRIPGNLIAAYLITHFCAKTIILSVLGVSAAGFFTTALFPGYIGIIAMLVIFLASGVVDPVVSGYLHHRGSSEIRATLESIQSLIERAITFIIGIGFGIIATKATVTTGFAFLGGVSCLFSIFLLKKTKIINFSILHILKKRR
ncbi:MFS transporter [Bacillus sp. FJAT-29814]|uniref:MFS transporter n=1 Tax=Bacillus sp. FJAT-29814 TaxID=1729688 RepID=UPI0009EC415A|nr:MFS transporter [Bacillus sp. FJAT-29814]